jgi:hypothetical protein
VESWRAVVTDPQLVATLDRVHDRLDQRMTRQGGTE